MSIPATRWLAYLRCGGVFTCNLGLESVNRPTVDGVTTGVRVEVVVTVFMEFGVGLRIYSEREEGTHLVLTTSPSLRKRADICRSR